MTEARPWLPANAIRDGVLGSALTAVAQTWSARWFAEPRAASIRVQDAGACFGMAEESLCWAHPADGFTLSLAPSAYSTIALAMLGLTTGAQKASVEDQRVLRELASICARDFALDAAQLFALEPVLDVTATRTMRGGVLRFALSLGDATQVLELYVDERHAIAARRGLLHTQRAAKDVESREASVARQRVEVGAMIGLGQLGLGDLRNLVRGDVIVLDRGPADDLFLAIDGVAMRDTPCRIEQDESALRMRIGAPESETS